MPIRYVFLIELHNILNMQYNIAHAKCDKIKNMQKQHKNKTNFIFLVCALGFLVACSGKDEKDEKDKSLNSTNQTIQYNNTKNTKSASVEDSINIEEYSFEIVRTLPHRFDAFTQGLVYDSGILYEGTGLETKSRLEKIDVYSGKILKTIELPSEYFGEGIALLNKKIYQVTWHNQKCLIYDKNSMKKVSELDYFGEAWGLTAINDSLLILSDGTSTLKFIEPKSFSVVSTRQVTYKEKLLNNINELELVGNKLFANIWGSDIIVIIDIDNGKVVGQIDISSLRLLVTDSPESEVANGIAYNASKDLFYFTGKNWSKIFEVKIKSKL